ncbi:hypothetical protein FQN60_005169 [Etheostoma spectabile]|uniref:Uncharacterized protein n=1 Tax=Etheostoma spectabile TaxID=54343 RepID=A0A5J5DLT8_9PERO|nr:hypothetical protein FQN60_005169 [Etheostoma spectabile]
MESTDKRYSSTAPRNTKLPNQHRSGMCRMASCKKGAHVLRYPTRNKSNKMWQLRSTQKKACLEGNKTYLGVVL